MHLVEQQQARLLLCGLAHAEEFTEPRVGHALVQHLRRGEKHVRRELPEPVAGEDHLVRFGRDAARGADQPLAGGGAVGVVPHHVAPALRLGAAEQRADVPAGDAPPPVRRPRGVECVGATGGRSEQRPDPQRRSNGILF